MPRAYTEDEQRRIRAGLIAAGRALFAQLGLQKVTVSELTGAVGIGKGSFYLFFDSKEALFFAVQETVEAEVKANLVEQLRPLESDPRALLEEYFRRQLALLDTHPFLRRVADPRTMQALYRKLPPEQLAQHRLGDRTFNDRLLERWIAQGVMPAGTDPELFFALSASMFALSLSREVVGPRYEAVGQTLARALAHELLAGTSSTYTK